MMLHVACRVVCAVYSTTAAVCLPVCSRPWYWWFKLSVSMLLKWTVDEDMHGMEKSSWLQTCCDDKCVRFVSFLFYFYSLFGCKPIGRLGLYTDFRFQNRILRRRSTCRRRMHCILPILRIPGALVKMSIYSLYLAYMWYTNTYTAYTDTYTAYMLDVTIHCHKGGISWLFCCCHRDIPTMSGPRICVYRIFTRLSRHMLKVKR